MRISKTILCLVVFFSAAGARADDARFDLPGPKIDVYVTRGSTTLPIAQVPELQPHDKLRVKADLPATQSNHLLLIVAFLRGTTNEPPDNWFTRIETWKQPPEGTLIVVPDGAQRAMLFVAPETGGDFDTLRSAVKGSPGLFIRANTSLNKASLEQQRIERYLAGMQTVTSDDEKVIQARSAKLAAALALKPDAACFKQPVVDQVDCLTQTSTPLLLDDGHRPTISDAISTGASGSFFNEAGQADNAVYSAYVGTLIDLIHLVGMLHTAQYRYIPAISFPQGPTLNLKLNAAPSFYNPKSVIVIALPAIQSMRPLPLVLAHPGQAFCLANPALTLPMRGAPLMYSTAFAHDLTLDFGPSALPASIPLRPDAFDGGLVRDDVNLRHVRHAAASSGALQTTATSRFAQGTIRGYWGFQAFEGPTLRFQQSEGDNWKLTGADTLVAGKNGQLTLHGDDTACISQIRLTSVSGESVPVAFTPATTGANAMSLEILLQGKQPGAYSLVLQQYGSSIQRTLRLTAYSADTHLEKVLMSMSGETAVVLGKGVENVLSAKIGEQIFLPAVQEDDQGSIELHASRTGLSTTAASAIVTLKDGRVIQVPVSGEDPGAMLRLRSFHSTTMPVKGELEVTLDSQQYIPLHSTLHFVVQSTGPFSRSQMIEVATADGALHTTLSLNSDSLILQDDHTVVGTLNLDKTFGESAFGELRLRAIPGDGTFGNWVTLGKLIRRPHITAVHCSDHETPTCMIEGRDLFLALAFSTTESFESEVPVQSGFDETTFAMPMGPSDRGEMLYVRLRDDPQAAAMIRISGRDAKP
jgi:hypothetical protein